MVLQKGSCGGPDQPSRGAGLLGRGGIPKLESEGVSYSLMWEPWEEKAQGASSFLAFISRKQQNHEKKLPNEGGDMAEIWAPRP